ncbi:hypothetical protein AB0B66_10645 [Catellatospora sp. NPDC049111]|uniref:hypothetical protein n=1 Tax=Catellatospora sp. NPDC049111 TaxID=3155271 RepID=UPI0033F1D141
MRISHTLQTMRDRSRCLATLSTHADELYSLAALAVVSLELRAVHPTAAWVIMEVVPSDSPRYDDDYLISTIRNADGEILLRTTAGQGDDDVSDLLQEFQFEARDASQYICLGKTSFGIADAGLPFAAGEEITVETAARLKFHWTVLNIDDLLVECDRRIPAGQDLVLVAPGVGS